MIKPCNDTLCLTEMDRESIIELRNRKADELVEARARVVELRGLLSLLNVNLCVRYLHDRGVYLGRDAMVNLKGEDAQRCLVESVVARGGWFDNSNAAEIIVRLYTKRGKPGKTIYRIAASKAGALTAIQG